MTGDDAETWALRPVIAKMVTMGEINRGEVDIYDLAMMNDQLAVNAENEIRYAAANKPG